MLFRCPCWRLHVVPSQPTQVLLSGSLDSCQWSVNASAVLGADVGVSTVAGVARPGSACAAFSPVLSPCWGVPGPPLFHLILPVLVS